MNKIATQVAAGLDAHQIAYRIEGEALRVPLPGHFGELHVAALNEDDSIVGLVDGEWHSHGDMLMHYGGNTHAEAIVLFITRIFGGRLLLIEERETGKPVRRIIEDDLEGYLKGLPEGAQYKIYNNR